MSTSDWKKIIYHNIKYENVFEHFVYDVAHETAKSISGIDNKRKKIGDAWEDFCCDYLNKILSWNVQKLKDCTDELLSLQHMKRNDVGIDLLGTTNEGLSVAIQCKFRSGYQKLSWRDVSTFDALCERTGPWKKRLVMTTSWSIRREGSRLDSDIFFGKHYFAKQPKSVWFRLGDMGEGHTLQQNVESTFSENTTNTTETLREKRSAFLDKLQNPGLE